MVLEKNMLINNRYRIQEQIGVGGMAIVYRAIDEKLDREVTFKVLKEDYINDEEFIKRFSTEARAAARLSNSNIVNVYDVGNDGNIHYIVMEYIDGFTLKELISSKAPFTDEEAVGIGLQIGAALEHAHKNGIVHRDIKPENILITKSGNIGTIKVTDFGIAKATTSKTSPIDFMGSVHYFSPEQAKGENVDTRSDIYSLGIVLFEMVTGQLPFTGETAVALAMKHLKEPIPDIKAINPNVSDKLVSVIKKATCKEPKNRYQTIAELVKDLKYVLAEIHMSKKEKENVYTDETVIMTKDDVDTIRNSQKHTENNNKKNKNNNSNKNNKKQELSQEDADYKKKEKKVILAAIITGIVLILGITMGSRMINNTLYAGTIKVPNFVGMTSEKAEALAVRKHITIETKEIYKENVDEGVVADQSVKKGERIKENETVTLYVSSGSNSVTVPKFEGYMKSKAEEIAEANNLVLVVEYVTSDELAGTVVEQDIKEGEKVAPKSEIKIKVSSGGVDEEVKVPDFYGKTKEEAEELLKEIGLTGKFIDGYSDTVPEGQVMDQGIDANSLTTKDTVLTLTVSQGPNKSVAEAQDEVTTLTPVISLPSSEPKEEKTTAPQGQAVRENNETVKPVQNPTAATRSVSVSVSPDFNNNSYNTDGSDVYSVKVVAESKNGSTRTILNDKYKVSDFPFSVNDKINSDTTYKVYLNNQVISTENH
ncbi:MAG: Stk1 family PASTA domain-containing Ser/Thr kinase [Lachnospirales bacterium]|nr:Stk1 family PASTA domain-containing Ser/Thr kinase [Eubacterium sp.]